MWSWHFETVDIRKWRSHNFFTQISPRFLEVPPLKSRVSPADSCPSSSCVSVDDRIFAPLPPTVTRLLLSEKLEVRSCLTSWKGVGHTGQDKLLQERVISFLLLFEDSEYFCDRNRDNITGIWWTYFKCFLICFSVSITWKFSVPFFWLWSKTSSRDNIWLYIFEA